MSNWSGVARFRRSSYCTKASLPNAQHQYSPYWSAGKDEAPLQTGLAPIGWRRAQWVDLLFQDRWDELLCQAAHTRPGAANIRHFWRTQLAYRSVEKLLHSIQLESTLKGQTGNSSSHRNYAFRPRGRPSGQQQRSRAPPQTRSGGPATAADLEAQRRAERAVALVHLGELSAARAALDATPLAPATDETLAVLRDPTKRPQTSQVPLPEWLSNFSPENGHMAVDAAKFFGNLRGARRGAAAGSSGCTAEHLRILLDDESCFNLLLHAAQLFAAGRVPAKAVNGLRLGRLVALQKPNGGIRALVMGDVFRRLVFRTLAQQASDAFMDVCSPFQYALSTPAGAEALARALSVSCELNPSKTVVSVDGVCAYDHIAKAAMFEGLRRDARLASLMPFVRQF